MNKQIIVLLLAIVGVLGGLFLFSKNSSNSSFSQNQQAQNIEEKVYVALEEEGKVAVLDAASRKVLQKIDLKKDSTHYMAHNVQVSSDGKSVWVTANAEGKHDTANKEEAMHMDNEFANSPSDEAVVIDRQTDTIIKRIPIATESHLAHIVLAPNNEYAYATAQAGNKIYKINTHTYEIEKEIATPKDSQPHGLRITPDGSKAFIALLGGKALGVLDLNSDSYSQLPLDGGAVQTGVTADGKYVFASVYNKKKVALYEIATQKLSYIALPDDAKGPLQMYATPDSRFVYLADQGYYFNQPIAEKVYKIDLQGKKVVKEIKAGQAPHGVVVSKDGKNVYITNLVSGDISIIDTKTDTEIARIPVGKQPNGISIWSKKLGATL